MKFEKIEFLKISKFNKNRYSILLIYDINLISMNSFSLSPFSPTSSSHFH